MSEYPPDEGTAGVAPEPEPYVEEPPAVAEPAPEPVPVDVPPPVEAVAEPEAPPPVGPPAAEPVSPAGSGYSPEWGTVEAGWSAEREPPSEPPEAVSWAHRGDSGCCGLEGVRTVVGELSGREPDGAEMVERGAANGWLAYDETGQVSGFRADDLHQVLSGYGVESRSFGGPASAPVPELDAWRELNDAVASRRRVMLGLEDGGYDVVTAVDYERGAMTVSHETRGAQLELPLDAFAESWGAGNYSMTVADAPGSEGGFALLGTSLAPELDAEAGTGAWVDMNALFASELGGILPGADDLLVAPTPDAAQGEPGGVFVSEFPRPLREGGVEGLAYALNTQANLEGVDPHLGPTATAFDAARRAGWPMLTHDWAEKYGEG